MSQSKPTELRLVHVHWEDASVVDDGVWVDKASAPAAEPVFFDDLGWLMEITAEHVVLSASMGQKLMAPRLRIPTGMVKSITEFDMKHGKPVVIPKPARKAAVKRSRARP